ncbi:MAG: ABC-type transport auxiliary lipoprotein family protein [Candidatus Acidiferrales bacterium]
MRYRVCCGYFLVAALALAGCGKTRPVKFFELSAAPAAPAPASNPYPISLLIGRITAPQLYRDNRIVYAMSDVEFGAYEYDRWAEPPMDMMEGALLLTLRRSGQYTTVERQSSNARGDYILRGRLLALEEVDAPALSARFSIELELFDPKSGQAVWTGSYSHDEPVTEKKVPAVVEALNRNVHAGFEQLAAQLSQFFANRPAH